MSAYDPKRTLVKIELRLGYPKSFFEGALEWMFMPTSERDDVGSLSSPVRKDSNRTPRFLGDG